MYYRPDFICTAGGRVVHLKFIESFGPSLLDEDATADKLKGDTILNIRTVSGAEYSVSINAVVNWIGEDPTLAHTDVVRGIYEQWARIQHKD